MTTDTTNTKDTDTTASASSTKTNRLQELLRLLIHKSNLDEADNAYAHKLVNSLADDHPDEVEEDPFKNVSDQELLDKAFAGDETAKREYKRRQVAKT